MKTLYTKILLLFTLVTFTLYIKVSAQVVKPTANVSGTVIDETGKPSPFATVALLKAKDSSLVKGAITTDAGAYTFDHVATGTYIVRATVLGYAKVYTKSIAVTADGQAVSAPAIKLATTSKTLNAVEINAAKPLIERKFDRTVMNVENSVLAAGNDAMEILARAPGVTIDKDDNISLRGKQGVNVMIDGKQTYLSAAQLATFLHSTDGSNIQSIELITNPSAKYDASGNSGIINIKLKKNHTSGTNGSVTVGAGIGWYPKDNQSITLNHKEGALNVYGTFNHNDKERANNLDIDRVIDTAGKQTYFSQHSFMPQVNHNNSYRLGLDYDLSKNNTLGILVSGFFNSEQDNNSNNTIIGSAYGKRDSSAFTTSQFSQTYHNFETDVNDKFTLDTLGRELSFDVDYSKFSNTNNAGYQNYYYLANETPQHPTVFLQNQSPSTIQINTEQVDYTHPFSKTVKMETGLKFSNVKTDNDLEAQIQTGGVYVNDPTRTNHFIYTENVNAAYVNLSKSYKNFSIQAGLRAENTNSTGNLITNNQVVDRSYTDLFPSVFLNQTIDAKNEIGFSYSRRIDRPQYDNLNPFIYYLDQYTYKKGNPFLDPQYTNSFEFNYTFNKTINVGINYSHTSNVMTEIILSDNATKATYQTDLNLNSQDAYGLNVNTPYQFTKWWSGNVNLNTFYLGFKSNGLAGGNLSDGQVTVQFKTTETFQLTKTFRMEFSTNYQSPLTFGIYKLEARYNVDGGLSKSFANKKANLKFSFSDIFDTQRNNLSANYQSTNFSIRQKNESQVARLTFTYNFGNNKLKTRQHQTGAESEKGRVNTGN